MRSINNAPRLNTHMHTHINTHLCTHMHTAFCDMKALHREQWITLVYTACNINTQTHTCTSVHQPDTHRKYRKLEQTDLIYTVQHIRERKTKHKFTHKLIFYQDADWQRSKNRSIIFSTDYVSLSCLLSAEMDAFEQSFRGKMLTIFEGGVIFIHSSLTWHRWVSINSLSDLKAAS